MRFLESVFDDNISFLMPYGSKWHETHRLLVSVLNPQSSNTYRLVQDIESTRFLFEALSGNQISEYFRRFSFRVSSTLVYGHKLEDADVHDQISEMSQIVDQIFLLLSPANALVDLFPLLDYVVRYLTVFHRKKEQQLRDRMAQIWFPKVSAAIRKKSCSFTQILYGMKPPTMTEEKFCYLIQELDLAINFTTPTLLDMFINVIILEPNSVQQVQDELVSVVGLDRLPSFEDHAKLPYLLAFMNEVYRWKQIAPFAVPRAVTEDTEYMGYRIPKDAIILENQWSICNDQNVYIDPETFQPERWLENPDLPKAPLFGAGKRSCPGEPLARNSIFIIIARLLWAFDIHPAHENTIEMDQPHGKSFLAFKLECPNVALQIRSPQHRAVIEREYANIKPREHRG
jgi:cytochrome P450